jgi:hypothetical protein
MIEFLNPLLWGGLAVVSAPVIIHLLHRRKVKQVDWGAMRFLLEMLAKRRRRLFLDDLLLLMVRALLLGCVGLAMVRPAFHRAAAQNAVHGIARQGRTAAVLLIDDSLSSAAGRAQPVFEAMKKLGVAYLDSLAPGDEISLVLMSQLGAPADDPLFDIEGLKTHLAGLKPSYVATDIPALLDAGLAQLKRHVNPGAELVLLTDGRNDGWHEQDKVRWDELRERLRGPGTAALGTRQRPQLILLAPEAATLDDNLAIIDIVLDRTLVAAGRPAGVRVMVANYGKQGSRQAAVQAVVNGQVIGSKLVEVPADGRQEVVFTHTFETAGSYAVQASLVNHQDLLPADDSRALSIQVETSVPVLLVDGANSPTGLQTKLGFLAAALDPDPAGPGPFKVTRISLAQLTPSVLQDYRVVVLGDLAVLDPAMVDALERFVVSGGGLLVGLGPDSDLALINRYWARNGEGFLPCPLERPLSPPKPALPAAISPGHPVFNGFGSKSDEAWKAAKVRSYFKLDAAKAKGAELDVLLTMDNGDALLVERRRGLGLVTLMATSLNADWTDLPLQAAYVPLMRGVAGHLGSFVMPPRNLLPGEPIIYARVKDPAKTMSAEDPSGKPIKLTLGSWEGRTAVLSEPLMEPGVYLLHDPMLPSPIRYAVSVAPAESTLLPMADRQMTQAFEGGASLFHNPAQIAANLDPARRQSVELWKWCLFGALGLMFIEGWMTRPGRKD